MHVYFSGIGGAGIGPLAVIAHQAGFKVSGSDKRSSDYITYLEQHGIKNIHIGQSRDAISLVHKDAPIDWFVYTSALPLENPDAPELKFCVANGIKATKRDEFINYILGEKKLELVAVAGTHGKTTTTAMVVWLFHELGVPISYLLPAKTAFAEMGNYEDKSRYFVYEADEFDRNFLAFKPQVSLITGVSWDHHEIFPTREDYQMAFREFISQSKQNYIWAEDAEYISGGEVDDRGVNVLNSNDQHLPSIKLLGKYNRLDAWLSVSAVHSITNESPDKLIEIINRFPGLSRRMEQIIPGLYSDYAHTPEKIRGAMSVASEMVSQTGQKLIVVYEPLTNRRQHYMIDDYGDCFSDAQKVYWLPSYLAREDPNQRILEPSELITHLNDPSIAVAAKRDAELKTLIKKHLKSGDMVVGIAGGGGDSLDDWLRQEFGT